MDTPNDNTAAKGLRGWWLSPPRPGLHRLISPWEYRHLGVSGVTRAAAGGFQLGIGLILLSLGRSAGTDQERRKMYRLSAWFLVPAAGNLAGGYWYITIANEPAARLERRYSRGKGNGRRVECVTISNRVARGGIGMALLMAVSVLAAACSGTTTQPATTVFKGASTASGSWPYPNGDLANTRDAAGSTISSANVSQLREAWSFKLAGKAAAGVGVTGSFAAAPVVVDSVVYIQDLDCNVYALSLATGKLLWEHQVNTPEVSGPGPNGVALGGGRLYGTTPHMVFALSAATGKVIWSDGSLLNKGQGSFEIQPQVAGGRVYLASAYGSGPGGGVLFALDASTGKVIWRFNTLLGADTGVRSVGLGSGGAWETPLVGSDGSVTFGTGNPYQNAASAMAHPSAQLYTDSDVNLAAATGKLRWYYQGVPNDYMDHDMQASPISVMVGGVPVVIGSGKMGIVYAMNASTGALLWKTPVGEHNGTDNDGLLLLEHKIKLTAPYTILPGPLGGVLSNMAVAGNSVYVATIDLAFKATSLSEVVPVTAAGKLAGEVEALSLATGKVEWHTKVPWLPLGAVTVSNDLVFTSLYNGVLLAFNRDTGAIVYRHQLPTSTNAPIAIAGNSVIVPAGAPGRLRQRQP